ncbi:hypothetical protein [Rubritalea tangerina]|uniref:hypothetical protein n=1 Tax=Rubritalea tangerina TaxID=430798 RepID=UPI00361FE0DC
MLEEVEVVNEDFLIADAVTVDEWVTSRGYKWAPFCVSKLVVSIRLMSQVSEVK